MSSDRKNPQSLIDEIWNRPTPLSPDWQVQDDRAQRRNIELLRARLDATTRAILTVEHLDEDDRAGTTVVRASELDRAQGIAWRNRKDFGLSDVF